MIVLSSLMIVVAGWDVEQDRHGVEALAWQASIGDALSRR
jgi:hypothetical protein